MTKTNLLDLAQAIQPARTDHFAALDQGEFDRELESTPAHDHGHDFRGRFTDAISARQYLQAGKATITLLSKKTGNRFTYRVTTPCDRETGEPVTDGTLMVGVLSGPNNDSDYQWLGRISRGIFWVGRKNPKPGEISRDAPSAKAFDWAWRMFLRGQMPEQLEVWHEGSCGRCGRKLTVPESVARGFGPECAGKIGLI
jgi:hypothetical protein